MRASGDDDGDVGVRAMAGAVSAWCARASRDGETERAALQLCFRRSESKSPCIMPIAEAEPAPMWFGRCASTSTPRRDAATQRVATPESV